MTNEIDKTKQADRSTARRPNLVFILADDMGWGDLSCYGRPDYTTPNLDKLAAQGVRLTDCYSGSATCSPTRISFMTGRYPARHAAGLAEPLLHAMHGSDLGLEPSFPALPRLLAGAGYKTALFGKWHCGEPPTFGPLLSGFDEFFGLKSTGAGYYSYRDEHGRFLAQSGSEDIEPPSASAPGRYLTEVITDKACDFITRQHRVQQDKTEPFYLSVHYTAPHWPWETPFDDSEACSERASSTNGGSIAIYAEMMKSFDHGVGRIMATLSACGMDADTLVVVTSDNGGERYSYHYPLTGYIRLLREGGIRVPGIARWSGRIPAGQVSAQTAITMDWTATFLEAAGARASDAYPLDGVDLMPVLSAERAPFDRTLFWRTPTQSAVRRGPWKLLHDARSGRSKLFNLVKDIREYADFSESHPQVHAELAQAFAEWERTVLPRPEPVVTSPVDGVDFQIF
ncbi:sulfatase-like hydrolase/transferase [soil metagenome]